MSKTDALNASDTQLLLKQIMWLVAIVVVSIGLLVLAYRNGKISFWSPWIIVSGFLANSAVVLSRFMKPKDRMEKR